MATARCYSKSGNVEKYESYLWISPSDRNWSSSDIVGTITTPDSNGNYTVTPAPEFEDSNTQTEFYCNTMYGGVRKIFYFKKKQYVYVSLSCTDDIVLNNVIYHPQTIHTIHTIDMSISGDDYIDIIIGLSSKYRGGSIYLFFKDGNGNIIQAKKYQDINLVVDYDLAFPVDNNNATCIISKYSNKLEEVGNIYVGSDGLSYYFGSTGWSNNTLYTLNKWNIIGGAPGPSHMKIDHYQSSFKITLDGHTRTIWLTTKIETLYHL